MSCPEAMRALLGGAYPAARESAPKPRKPFALPDASADMRRVYAYLRRR